MPVFGTSFPIRVFGASVSWALSHLHTNCLDTSCPCLEWNYFIFSVCWFFVDCVAFIVWISVDWLDIVVTSVHLSHTYVSPSVTLILSDWYRGYVCPSVTHVCLSVCHAHSVCLNIANFSQQSGRPAIHFFLTAKILALSLGSIVDWALNTDGTWTVFHSQASLMSSSWKVQSVTRRPLLCF